MKKRILPLLLALALLLSACGAVPQSPAKAEGTLTVHFLDVGQADCALVELNGQYLLIDGGNKEDSQLVVSFLEQQGVEELEGVVCTHAHEDHVGGLPGVLAVYPAKAVYAPTKTYASKVFDDFVYYTDQQGLEITIPEPGDSIPMEGLDIQVLGPVKSYAETNDTSLVLRIAFGETVFLFTGDMETAAEDDMLDYWDSQPPASGSGCAESGPPRFGHLYRLPLPAAGSSGIRGNLRGNGQQLWTPQRSPSVPAESGGGHGSAHRYLGYHYGNQRWN